MKLEAYSWMKNNDIHEQFIKDDFTIAKYEEQILSKGLDKVWDSLIDFLERYGIDRFSQEVVDFYDIGRLYEIGLAIENKYSKKEAGKYYTPRDVSRLMSNLLVKDEKVTSVADVGCGCGNLIIEVLSVIKERSTDEFNRLKDNIYLFEIDKIAIKICKARLRALFGIDPSRINIVCGDFLTKKAHIPNECYVISNPPYRRVKKIEHEWEYKRAISESKDLYVGFIEKIVRSSKKAVVVSPQSYIVGNNFSTLRTILYEEGFGEIYSFDNVPGTLFNGRKQGVFNSNTANGVRASILVFNKSVTKGYHLTHLIRFKNDERKQILNVDYLHEQLGSLVQDLTRPLKCFKELETFVQKIEGNDTIHSLIEEDKNKQNPSLCIHVNSSGRYFIVASSKPLNRSGIYDFYAKDQNSYYLLYALLNSSYVYMWWRMLDGGILVPKRLILNIPLPSTQCLNNDVINYCKKLMQSEKQYLVYKKNAGNIQESIKFPKKHRENLNKILFGNITFEIIHSSKELI